MAGASLSGPHPTIANLNVILADSSANSSYILLGSITGNPDTTASTYQVGCRLWGTDTGIVYTNTGTAAAPVWSVTKEQTQPSFMITRDNLNGSNNALCVSLFAYGTTKVALTTGTRILIYDLKRSLQVGSNTLNVNGTTKNILKASSLGNLTSAVLVSGTLDVVHFPGIKGGCFVDLRS